MKGRSRPRGGILVVVSLLLISSLPSLMLGASPSLAPAVGGPQVRAASWNGLEPGWTMFHGGSGVNGSFNGYFPGSHFEVEWEANFSNTSYYFENNGPVAPQSSPVVFNGTVYLMDSSSPVLLAINATTGNLTRAYNLGAVSGQPLASVDSTPLIGTFNGAPYLTESTNRAGTHMTYTVDLSTGAITYCHSGQPVSAGAAPIPGGFVQPTQPYRGNPNGIFVFHTWALGNNNANCAGVETTVAPDNFNDTPSVGLTYSPAVPTSPDPTYFLSDQTQGTVDSLPANGGAMQWADPLLAPAYGSLALTNLSYAVGPGGSVSAPVGFLADDNGTAGPSHLYAIDVNCGTAMCFAGGNNSNTIPGGVFNLSLGPSSYDHGVNGTVALQPITPDSVQVLYATRDGTLGGVQATLGGASPLGPNETGGYHVAWTSPWQYPTGGNLTASPALANGLVMDGNAAGNFTILNSTSGTLVWRHQFPGAIFASPAIGDGSIYVLTATGTLVKIGPSPPGVALHVDPVVTDGWTTPVNVTVNATGPQGGPSGPLSGASVTLWARGGVLVGAQNVGTLVTSASGGVSFSWVPPLSPTNQTYNLTAFVNASGYATGNATASTLAVPPPQLLVTSMSATPSSFPLGGSTMISVSVSGGFLPYNYTYTGLPSGCTSLNLSTLRCTPNLSGNYTVNVTVRDPAGASTQASAQFVVTATSTPLITSFSAIPPSIGLGNSTTFLASVIGGAPPYTYLYSSLPGGCTSSNASSMVCTPTTPGAYNVTLRVTDTLGRSATAYTPLGVTSPPGYPVVVSFVAQPSSINLGATTTLRATVVNGTLPYLYSYSGLPPGCYSANTSTLGCTPTSVGPFSVVLGVTDSLGHSVRATTLLTVLATGNSPTIVSFVANPPVIPLGDTSNLTVGVVNGTAPYSYRFTGLPAGCATADSSQLRCTPTLSGNFTIGVQVTDSLSRSANDSTLLQVVPASQPVILRFTATLNPVAVGNTTRLVVAASGGSAPYAYVYTGLPSGCLTQNLSTLPCKPLIQGNYTVRVTMTDSNHRTAQGNLTLRVTAGPGGGPPGHGATGVLSASLWWLLIGILVLGVLLLVLLAARRRKRPPGSSSTAEGTTAVASGEVAPTSSASGTAPSVTGAGDRPGLPGTSEGSEWDEEAREREDMGQGTAAPDVEDPGKGVPTGEGAEAVPGKDSLPPDEKSPAQEEGSPGAGGSDDGPDA